MQKPNLRQICLPLSLLILQPLSTIAAAEVGTTSGAFAVSPSGAATYSIPITVPPGIAGMQPKLSIEYNSQGGNGPLGVGFSLGGLSAVTRCPATLEQDGFIDGVDFDDDDRYCMDGQRLMAISATEYRTELESFSKVVAYGGTAGDPGYFKVWTKAGLIMEFGATADARAEAQGKSQALMWALNKVGDTAGNYFTVSYSENNSTGESVPQSIQYAGGASVAFAYESRSDYSTGYISGSLVTQSLRMTKVQTLMNGSPVREYRLTYQTSAVTARSQLSAVEECGITSGAWHCLPATQFEWLPESTSGAVSTLFNSSVCANDSTAYGVCNDGDNRYSVQYPDINSDGRADVCYRADQGVKCFLSTGTGLGAYIDTGICANGWTGNGTCNDGDNHGTIGFPDWDGDGMADLVYRGDNGVRAYRSTGMDFVPLFWTTFCANNHNYYGVCNDSDNHDTLQYPDINGDGMADICYRGDQGVNCFLAADGGITGPQIQTDICANGWTAYGVCDDADNHYTVMFVDMNADGMADLVYRGNQGIQVWRSTGAGFTHLYSTSVCANNSDCSDANSRDGRQFPDINGDGLSDICYRNSQGVNCYLNTGSGLGLRIQTDICADGSYAHGVCNDADNFKTIAFADMNGDGMSDLVYRGDSGLRVWRSTGVGFVLLHSTTVCANGSGAYGGCNDADNYDTLKYPDINGDGFADIAFRSDSGITVLKTGTIPSALVKGIQNGLGARINVTYKPLTDSSVYSKGAGASYPARELQVPMHVVSEHQNDNGIGGFNRVTYKYSGAKAHLRGRGMLGFASQTITNEVTGSLEHTEYRQDFPYIGMPTYTITRASSGLVISQAETSYDKVTLGSGSAATQFVFAKKTINRSWDITSYNRVITSQVTENEYGEYPAQGSFFGNLTRSVVSTYAGYESGGAVPFATVTANTYSNNTSLWHLGRLTRSQVTRSAPGAAAATRTSAFEYHPQTGLLSAEIIEPDNPVFRLRTDYARDGFGNIVETTVSGADIVGRTTRREFDLTGRFNTRTINALAHAESRTFDSATGNVLISTGPNGLVTTYQYDVFGRAIGESFNQHGVSTSKSVERHWCAGSGMCQSGEVFYIRSYDNAGSDSYAFFDLLEREVRKAAKSGNGQLVEVLTQYNTRGEVFRKSSPRFQSGALYWTTYIYDAIGRVSSESAPAGQGLYRDTTFTYDGLVTTQNVEGQITRRQTNALGKPIAVTDHLNGQIIYTYDAFENLLTTRDAGGATTSMVYDLRGRKIEMTEPNMGRWKYSYNVLGELVRQEDAKGQVTTMSYDLLGRMVQRSEPEGVTDWVYDTLWKGALTSVSTPDYIRSYAYTLFGAAASETTSIASTTPPSAPTASSTPLQNGQPVTGQSGSAGTELRFTLAVPSGATGLKIYSYGGTGDADLYVKLGSAPTPSSYTCRSIASSNNDTCILSSTPGTWHVLVRGYSSFAGLSVVGTYAYNGGTTVLQKDVPVNSIAGYAGTEWRYTFDVPNGTTSIRFTTNGGNGDSALYVRYNAAPTTTSYDCRSDQYGNNYAVCGSVAYNGVANLSVVPYMGVPPPGRYHVMVRGVTSFFGVSLTATYSQVAIPQPPPVNPPPTEVEGIPALVPNTMAAPPHDSDGSFTINWGSATRSLCLLREVLSFRYFDLEMATKSGFEDATRIYSGTEKKYRVAGLPTGDYYFRVKPVFRSCSSFNGGEPCDEQSASDKACGPYVGPNHTRVDTNILTVLGLSNSNSANDSLGTSTSSAFWAEGLESLLAAMPPPPEPSAPSPSNLAKEFAQSVSNFFGASTTSSASGGSSDGFAAQSSSGSASLDRTLSYTYDSLGRPSEITYPTSLKVRHGYNANGAWDTVSNVATGIVYWRAQSWDEWGSAYQTTLGNGVGTFLSHDPASGVLTAMMTGPGGSSTVQSLSYQWDARGNLLSRNDNRQGLQETFSYDGLDRLSSNRLYGVPGISGGTSTLALTYAANGNITSKTGMGSYTYGAKPQAVTSAGGYGYSYDANGNMQTAGARNYTWTSYNLPSRIAESDSATDFLYGPERQRIRQSSSSSARGGRLTYFFHALYEEQAYSSYTEQKHHINTPQGVVAIETKGPTNKTEYLHRDHLGSIDVITNAAGQVTQRLSFDAFGKRRGESWELKTTQPDFYTNWGYTGHQQQDDFGLIHMRGRVYDPGLGRFISADPFVQAPENTQSYNRYSYVMNNPLAYTDPSGYGWKSFWKKWWRPIVAIVVTVVSWGTASAWAAGWVAAAGITGTTAAAVAAGAITGAALGAVSGGILTGTWKGALRGAGAGAIMGGIAGYFGSTYSLGRVAADAVGGGISTELNGGTFREGLYAGAFTSAAGSAGIQTGNMAADSAIAAVVGGTAAELGGGKFANGAVTGAFAYAFGSLAQRGASTTEDGAYEYESSAFTGESLQVASAADFLVGLGDGASFGLTAAARDAWGITGDIDFNSSSYEAGFWIGTADSIAASGLSIGGRLIPKYSLLNQNRYLRLGPGTISRSVGRTPFNYGPGRDIPMLRIGNGRPSDWNHLDLRVLGR